MNEKLIAAKSKIIENIQNTAKKLAEDGFQFLQELESLQNLPASHELLATLNQIKQSVVEKLKSQNNTQQKQKIAEELSIINVDVNRPVYCPNHGTAHPITQVIQLASKIASNMGFKLCHGPDIESEHNNFDALNIPAEHPARQMVDTFYIHDSNAEKKLLRTHTSSVQIRHLKTNTPPIKIFSVGRVFRKDSDATHTPMFHQMEVLLINNSANMVNLLETVKKFLSLLLEVDNLEYQARSSYFPFTEPSIEIDIKIDGKWLEVMGAGMVHPNVLLNSGIDPNIYQGYAWGLGLDRIAMIKYGIKDLRHMFNSNIKWLQYYGL